MTSQPLKVTLVGGSGRLGPYILSALQSKPELFAVTVLTRNCSTATFPPSTTLVRVSDDYPYSEMVSHFRGQDAVVLSLGFQAEARSQSLIDASIEAGVKRLIPSFYGASVKSDEMVQKFPVAGMKRKLLDYLETKNDVGGGWSWSAVCCGLVFDYCVGHNFFSISHEPPYKATILDDGTATFTCTNRPTIGHAVASILSSPANRERSANRIVHIASFAPCFNTLLAAYQKATGSKPDEWTITRVDSGEEVAKGEAQLAGGDFMGMPRIGKAMMVRQGMGQDLEKEGLLDNEWLGLEKENLDDTVERVLREDGVQEVVLPPAGKKEQDYGIKGE